MGNNTSCQNVVPIVNRICDIGRCTQSVRGIGSNSGSPTDIWILTLKQGTRYGNIIVNGKVVLKIFISEWNGTPRSEELMYESEIYESVIGSMFANYINPHFVPYYGRALRCDINQLADILDDNQDIDTRKTAVRYNTAYYSHDLIRRRPSINDTLINADRNGLAPNPNPYVNELDDPRIDYKYGLIATASANGITFSDFIRNPLNSRNGEPSENMLVLLIQILSALCALSCFKCAHNDLHTGNIFVNTKSNQELPFSYQSDTTIYSFRQNSFIAAIYDWDRSYTPGLGDNPLITQYYQSLCEQGMNCNEFILKRDTLKFLTYLIDPSIFSRQFISDLKNIISNTTSFRQFYNIRVLQGPNPYFLIDSVTNKTIQRNDFNGMRTPYEILTQMINYCNYKYPGSVIVHPQRPRGHIHYDFRCKDRTTYINNKSHFDINRFVTNSDFEWLQTELVRQLNELIENHQNMLIRTVKSEIEPYKNELRTINLNHVQTELEELRRLRINIMNDRLKDVTRVIDSTRPNQLEQLKVPQNNKLQTIIRNTINEYETIQSLIRDKFIHMQGVLKGDIGPLQPEKIQQIELHQQHHLEGLDIQQDQNKKQLEVLITDILGQTIPDLKDEVKNGVNIQQQRQRRQQQRELLQKQQQQQRELLQKQQQQRELLQKQQRELLQKQQRESEQSMNISEPMDIDS